MHIRVKGHWLKARNGYADHAPPWVENSGKWRMEPGRWIRGSSNRDDARPNHPERN